MEGRCGIPIALPTAQACRGRRAGGSQRLHKMGIAGGEFTAGTVVKPPASDWRNVSWRHQRRAHSGWKIYRTIRQVPVLSYGSKAKR